MLPGFAHGTRMGQRDVSASPSRGILRRNPYIVSLSSKNERPRGYFFVSSLADPSEAGSALAGKADGASDGAPFRPML
jgi:hypothetical protein